MDHYKIFAVALLIFTTSFISCAESSPETANTKSTPTTLPQQVNNNYSTADQNKNQSIGNTNQNPPQIASNVPMTVTDLVREFLTMPWGIGSANEYQAILEIARDGCYPSFANNQSCKEAIRTFIAIKDANAKAKTQSSGQSLCTYNEGLKQKYRQIEQDYCFSPGTISVPDQMKSLTGAQYCKIGRLTAEILDARHTNYCT